MFGARPQIDAALALDDAFFGEAKSELRIEVGRPLDVLNENGNGSNSRNLEWPGK